MKKTILSVAVVVLSSSMYAQIYKAKSCEIKIFKTTAIEDISGVNKITSPLLNTATGDLQMKMVITSFMFEKPLMQEHFNETYMESDKFPNAIYKGKINEKIDYTKDGEHKVTTTGKLTVHGVEKDITESGTLSVKGQEIHFNSTIKILFSDYKVDIPTLQSPILGKDIEVKINATLEPFKKN